MSGRSPVAAEFGREETIKSLTHLGAQLQRARKKRRLSLRHVAAESELNSGYVSLIEQGKVKQPRPDVLRKLAPAYQEPFAALMSWAGYVEDHEELSANQRRALSLLGPDPSEDELEALEMILSMLRKAQRAPFTHIYDQPLAQTNRAEIQKAVRAALREADAIGRYPTPIEDVVEVAELLRANELTLSLEDQRALTARFGETAARMWRRLQGAVDFRSNEVWVKPGMYPLKARFVLSHEVGHKLLAWQRDTFAFLDDSQRLSPAVRDIFEREANQAAIEILTQAGRMREEADDDNPPGVRTIQSLSAKYGVSLQATARYIAENSKRECACAISFKTQDGRLTRYHLFCSESFESRMGWQRGRAPELTIDALLVTRSVFDERPGTICADAAGDEVELQTGVIDTPRAALAFFGHRPRRKVTLRRV